MEVITIEIGNSSWWKNKKYRKEAVKKLKELRKHKLLIKLIKKYKLNTSNTIIYGDYLIKKNVSI
jgi:hypothetical protein|tara:strand:- start:477 stop:671 length:195 start_codon:yes stop_codon:yes gene_type:complete